MPSKKEKQQALLAMKNQATPLANSTNTISENLPLENSYQTVTTSSTTTTTKKLLNLNTDSLTSRVDQLGQIRDQKSELDQLNNRFSNYVLALRKKSQENDDLHKQVDAVKQNQKVSNKEDHNGLDNQMNELRNEIDESTVSTEHFRLKRNEALKELAFLKEKIRNEEDQSFANRRQTLENDYQQSVLQLKDLKHRFDELEKSRANNQSELNQLNDLYKQLEEELHNLILNNLRSECNLRTIEEQILLTKAIYETEKAELANEQAKQQQFYNNELDKAIDDIKQDFQVLLKTNKVILENAYTERIEQVKTQISTYQSNPDQNNSMTLRQSVDGFNNQLKQAEKARDDLENEYRPLIDLFLNKQKEKTNVDEERIRLDAEYRQLLNEINQITDTIELAKQHWFSVHFELETYRRLLDLQTKSPTFADVSTSQLTNGKEEHETKQPPTPAPASAPVIQTKKTESQRAISKTGKFDIDQVQVGFISINNAATNCVDQLLKGWTLNRTVNDGEELSFQFPDQYTLKARTRVRVYSNRLDNVGSNNLSNSRLIASAIPAWASTGAGENVKIVLLDDKGVNRAQYTERWQ